MNIDNTRDTSYVWPIDLTQLIPIPEGETTMLYLALYEADGTDPAAASRRFNITAASTKPTSTSSSLSTEISTTNPALTPDPTKSPKNNSEDPDNGDSRLSTGAVAGITVGAMVGGLLILSTVGFWLWKHYRRGSGAEYMPGQQHEAPTTAYYEAPG